MLNYLKKLLSIYLVSIVMIIAAFIFLSRIESLSVSWILVIEYLPYVLFLIAMILGYGFNRSSIFFISLLLCMSLFGMTYIKSDKIIPLIAVLLPLNILTFAFLKERGIFSLWGKLRFVLITAQVVFVVVVVFFEKETIINFITYDFLSAGSSDTIYQLPAIILLLSFIIINIKAVTTTSFRDGSISGVIMAITIAILLSSIPIVLPVFFTAAGLILVLTLIQVSYKMAYIDELTSIPSRRALQEDMMKLGSKYTIAMLDIDFFKKFNDKYGHDVGDEVLKLVAGVIKNVPGGGKAFRYGGEEFTVLFPHKTIKDVLTALETIRTRVSKKAYIHKKGNTQKKLYVTISIGVAEKNSRYKTPDEVIKAADRALYRAKKKGRNCVSK